MNAVPLQKLRDLDVVAVLFALEIVFYQDKRLLGRATDAIKFPVGAAFFDRSNPYLIDIESLQVSPPLPKKDLGSHDSDLDVALGVTNRYSGADKKANELAFESKFITGP